MNYKLAFAVGLIAPGVMAVREPVAYLYNGVRLPKLPEWDKETYPYAYLYYISNGLLLVLDCWSIELVVDESETELINPSGDTVSYVRYYYTGSEFKYNTQNETELPNGLNTLPIWANHDVLTEDGTLYLSASEPIPVYE